MTVYVVVRVAKETSGEVAFGSAEKAFIDPSKAETWVRSNGTVWEEVIQGFSCYCERAIHILEVEE